MLLLGGLINPSLTITPNLIIRRIFISFFIFRKFLSSASSLRRIPPSPKITFFFLFLQQAEST